MSDAAKSKENEMEDAYLNAAKALNAAAYAALRAAVDTTALPYINRKLLRNLARATDAIVDAGIDTARFEI